jgi:hypothetical protein
MAEFLKAAAIVTIVGGLASIPVGLFCGWAAMRGPPHWMKR